jgi:hypothetical protein
MHAQDLLSDFAQLFESLVIHNTVYQQKAIPSVHERLAQGGVSVLSGSVKDFDLHGLSVNVDGSLVRLLDSRVIL